MRKGTKYDILAEMKDLSFDERIDALCERQCAFALYRLPGGQHDHFCMQEDGRCGDARATLDCLSGETGPAFVISPFVGEPLCLRCELSEPPRAGRFRRSELRELPPPTTREAYRELFEACRRQLHREGESGLRKLVLARCCDEPRPEGFSPAAAFRRLCEEAPRSFRALMHTPQTGTWLCATPELLLSGSADSWETMALAGTRRCSAEPWDAKNAEEQALVALHVRAAVAGVAERLEEQPAESLPAGEIEHLCSRMTFRMSRRYLPQLIDELQPTPAVSGYPVRLAMEYLRRHPDTERGCYAGFLGPVDACSARFFVMLRCMQVLPDRCRLYAGGGIMPDSCEEDEWLETEAKMEPMRRLLR